jgi:hypothetical protein
MEFKKHTERSMTWMLAFRHKYQMRSHILIPNLSWGFLEWEADFVAISRVGYLTEIEIKVSKADLLADASKYKFQDPRHKGWAKIKEFYYAVPESLVKDVPESYRLVAGIISVPINKNKRCKVIHEAPIIGVPQKLDIDDIGRANRLLGMRYWTNFKNKKMI